MISAIQLPDDFRFGENALASYNRCFVVGNGPTLNKFNLESLKDEIVFGVNRILLSGFKPTILSISDKNCLYNSYADVIQKSKCDLLISKKLYEILSNDKKIDHNRVIHTVEFYPHSLFPYDYNQLYGEKFIKIQSLGNVLNDISVPSAIYMGIKKIYLIGVDSYHTQSNSWHFYDDSMSEDVRNFILDLARYQQIWASKQDVLARSQGFEILNLTPGTWHLGFKRVDPFSVKPDLVNTDVIDVLDKIVIIGDNLYKALPPNNAVPSACSLLNIKTNEYLRHSHCKVFDSPYKTEIVYLNDSSFYPESSFVNKNLVSFRSCNIHNYYITKDIFGHGYRIRRFNESFFAEQSSFQYY